jgi:putative tricarboxylic transport membrane protein
MKIADRVAGFVLLAFAGYIFVNSISLGYVSEGVPGAGFLPLWAGAILAVSAIVILAKSWKTPLSGLLIANRTVLWRTVIFGLGMAVMVFMMPYLGMVVTLALFMLFGVPFLGARHPLKIAASVTLVPLFVYVLFQLVLQVPLPVGPWRF